MLEQHTLGRLGQRCSGQRRCFTTGAPGFSAGHSNAISRYSSGRLHAKPSTKVSEELSPLELLRRENELLRETINSADSAIEELEAQLQVSTRGT